MLIQPNHRRFLSLLGLGLLAAPLAAALVFCRNGAASPVGAPGPDADTTSFSITYQLYA